jgi:uncharacterized membrane protein
MFTIIARVDRLAADVGFDRLSQRQPLHVLERPGFWVIALAGVQQRRLSNSEQLLRLNDHQRLVVLHMLPIAHIDG